MDNAARFPITVAAPRLHQTGNQGRRRPACRRHPRLPGLAPGPLETHAFLTPALQNQQLTPRRAGPFGTRLDARAACGQSHAPPIRLFNRPSRTGGQSKPMRSGTLAYGYLPGSTSQTKRFSQHPWLRSSQVGLRSAASSPARSAWLRQRSGMVGSLVRRAGAAGRGNHGTSWPSR